MRKLMKYPPQALSYLQKGQFIVILTSDIEKIAASVDKFTSIIVS